MLPLTVFQAIYNENLTFCNVQLGKRGRHLTWLDCSRVLTNCESKHTVPYHRQIVYRQKLINEIQKPLFAFPGYPKSCNPYVPRDFVQQNYEFPSRTPPPIELQIPIKKKIDYNEESDEDNDLNQNAQKEDDTGSIISVLSSITNNYQQSKEKYEAVLMTLTKNTPQYLNDANASFTKLVQDCGHADDLKEATMRAKWRTAAKTMTGRFYLYLHMGAINVFDSVLAKINSILNVTKNFNGWTHPLPKDRIDSTSKKNPEFYSLECMMFGMILGGT